MVVIHDYSNSIEILYTFYIGEHTDSYLNQHSDYHIDMTKNSSELSSLIKLFVISIICDKFDKLFVISSPFSVNPIITNRGFSRLVDNFTYLLC